MMVKGFKNFIKKEVETERDLVKKEQEIIKIFQDAFDPEVQKGTHSEVYEAYLANSQESRRLISSLDKKFRKYNGSLFYRSYKDALKRLEYLGSNKYIIFTLNYNFVYGTGGENDEHNPRMWVHVHT